MSTYNFWQQLKSEQEAILALAPMAGFTTSIFRRLCCRYGADVVYSEMASVSALHYSRLSASFKKNTRDNGGEATLKLLKYEPELEKYYVVQMFGADPHHFETATKIISQEIKPHGLDINFGCPVGKIIKQGAGADLMKDLKRSREVIKAVLANTDLPVSIKLRLQAGAVNFIDFIKNISDLKIAAVMIHGRSLNTGFSGQADFSGLAQVRKYYSGIILANGGINNLQIANETLKLDGVDGLGLARGVLGRPWLFQEIKSNKIINLNLEEIFKIILEQAILTEQEQGHSTIIDLRKHLVWYVIGQAGASRLRSELVQVNTVADLKKIFQHYFKSENKIK